MKKRYCSADDVSITVPVAQKIGSLKLADGIKNKRILSIARPFLLLL